MRGSLGSGFKNLRLVLVIIALMFYSSVVTQSQNLDGYFLLFKKLLGKNCGGSGHFAPPFLNKANIFNIDKICCLCFGSIKFIVRVFPSLSVTIQIPNKDFYFFGEEDMDNFPDLNLLALWLTLFLSLLYVCMHVSFTSIPFKNKQNK